MPIPLQWIGLFGVVTVFTVMLVVKILQPSPPVAAGIVLMAISPGAPIALRRALDAGGDPSFAPALHLAIVLLAVVTVPLSVLILDWVFSRDFAVTPLHIGRQVFFAQLLPLALGATLRAWRPALAARLQPGLVRIGNLLLLVLTAMILADVPAIFGSVGWIPTAAGFAMTIVALTVGWAVAGRDARARPAAAVAAGMRNPALALLIATLNRAPSAVIEGIVGYTVGLALAIVAFLQWRKRAARD